MDDVSSGGSGHGVCSGKSDSEFDVYSTGTGNLQGSKPQCNPGKEAAYTGGSWVCKNHPGASFYSYTSGWHPYHSWIFSKFNRIFHNDQDDESQSFLYTINTVDGNQCYTVEDFAFPSKGYPIIISRTYNSKSFNNTEFGYGWVSTTGVRLLKSLENKKYLLITDNGYQLEFPQNANNPKFYDAPLNVNKAFLKLEELSDTKVKIYCKSGARLYFELILGVKEINGNIVKTMAYKLMKVVDHNGNYIKYSYNKAGAIKKVSDDTGVRVEYEYDEKYRVKKISDTTGRDIVYEYDEFGDLVKITDPMGYITRYEYQKLLLEINNKQYYYSTHNLIKEIDKNGNVKEYKYNEEDQCTEIRTEDQIVQANYDNTGRRNEFIDKEGNKTIYEYDEKGRVVKIIDPLGFERIQKWDSAGNLIEVIDENGNIKRYEYDRNGNKISETDALGNRFIYTYDNNLHRKTSKTDPLGRKTIYKYDNNGNLTNVVYPDGYKAAFRYDDKGRLIYRTDRNNNKTEYEYDEYGNQTKIIDAVGNIKEYEYDDKGNKIREKDAKGNVIEYEYNELNQLTGQKYPNGGEEKYEYDALGNVTKSIDLNGNETQYEYNGDNKLVKITF